MKKQLITHNVIFVDNTMGDTTLSVYAYSSYKDAVQAFIKYIKDMKKIGKIEYNTSELKKIVEDGKYMFDEDSALYLVKSETGNIENLL